MCKQWLKVRTLILYGKRALCQAVLFNELVNNYIFIFPKRSIRVLQINMYPAVQVVCIHIPKI
jgi:hypothetical protein